MPGSLIWDNDSKLRYKEALQSDVISDVIENLSNNIENYSVDKSVLKITNILNYAVDSSRMKRHQSRSGNFSFKNNKPWFDKECELEKHNLELLAKMVQKHPTNKNLRENLNQMMREFKKLTRSKSRIYTKSIVDKMSLKYSNPKEFWCFLDKLKENKSKDKIFITNIHPQKWIDHVQNLLYKETQNQQTGVDTESVSPKGPPLNHPINENELTQASKRLKPGKASGLDQITNEMLIILVQLYPDVLCKLFTKILYDNKFPRAWITGMLLPLHKKGPTSCVGNYRGIMLLSCLGKLFLTIINERLLNFLHQNNILAKEQVGFMRGNRTSDNLIILHSLSHQNFKKGKNLYACFIDFEKEFDSVPKRCWRN